MRRGLAQGARWTLYPWSAYWRGTHEVALDRTLCSLGDLTGWSCWDLGAHFGIYSIGLARRVGPGGEVAAFEPNPVSYERLVRHGRMNRLANLKCFRAAVSDQAGTTELLTYGSLRSTTTHLAYDGEVRQPSTKPIAIQSVVLDGLVAAGELRPPDFVKVDVEGHGHHALAGARRALAAKRPLLVIAFHSPSEVEGILGILQPLGYRWESIPPAENSDRDTGEAMIGRDYLFRPTPPA